MVHRDDLLIFLAGRCTPSYNRKPVASVMNRAAVQIDARARLDQVSRLVTARTAGRPRDDSSSPGSGRYLGMDATIDLLRHITAKQIQAANSQPADGAAWQTGRSDPYRAMARVSAGVCRLSSGPG